MPQPMFQLCPIMSTPRPPSEIVAKDGKPAGAMLNATPCVGVMCKFFMLAPDGTGECAVLVLAANMNALAIGLARQGKPEKVEVPPTA